MTVKPTNIYQRILSVTDDIGSFTKDGTNERFHFKYAGIESIVQALQKPCDDHGICLIQEARMLEPIKNEGKDIARCEVITRAINIDDPTDLVTTVTAGYGYDTLDKGIYKAISGARKYAIFGLFNLHAGDEEPDAYQPAHEPARQSSGSTGSTTPRQDGGTVAQKQNQKSEKGIKRLRKILFPGLAEWPPKNDKDYEVRLITDRTGNMAWSAKPFPKKNSGALKGECSGIGFSSDEERHSLFNALYTAFEVPQNERVVSTDHMLTAHGSFLFDCINHGNIMSKEPDATPAWTRPAKAEPTPEPPANDGLDGEIVPPEHPNRKPDDVDLDPDLDLEEDEDFFTD